MSDRSLDRLFGVGVEPRLTGGIGGIERFEARNLSIVPTTTNPATGTNSEDCVVMRTIAPAATVVAKVDRGDHGGPGSSHALSVGEVHVRKATVKPRRQLPGPLAEHAEQ